MGQTGKERILAVFLQLSIPLSQAGKEPLIVTCPADGSELTAIPCDTLATVHQKIQQAGAAQPRIALLKRAERMEVLEQLSAAVKQHRELLAECIHLEAGKTPKEALGEVDSAADVLIKTCKDASLTDLNGMHRCKERPPVGVVGLITSFNFPLVVACWTLAPALLAGNSVVWKPSEKTPLTALAFKAIFTHADAIHAPLLQLLIGGREVGEAMVAHESVAMISATGSVAMGKGIKATLARKTPDSHKSILAQKPILELGGNNGVIISPRLSPEHLAWSVTSLLNSFLGTTGQRCTNTRRLIVHHSIYDQVVEQLEQHIKAFLATHSIASPLSEASNDYGYGPLIDHDAYQRFVHAKERVVAEGGTIRFGARLCEADLPKAYYIEPTLALLPRQTPIMLEETFAPLLFIIPYDGDVAQALALLNEPENAGLVNGIYTQSQKEADHFAVDNGAGHSVINSAKGTGTPAFGMGFGGNKASGEGEILGSADPLRPFTRDDRYRRIAQNAEIIMFDE